MLNHSSLNEHDLLTGVASGDENAFRQLFTLYHHRLGAYIYNLTDSMELAEEIVQDVFLKIWINRDVLANIKSFKAYLFVVSKNHALNCLRKVARERSHATEWDDNVVNAIAVEEDEQYNRYDGLLDKAINNLPPQQKKVYMLSRQQHLKYKEIAAKLNISAETVKKHLQVSIASITSYVQANIDLAALLVTAFYFF
ncbi:RNA polymerase sigma-70 factor [Mucilaginibacter sp. AW1-3]